MSRFAPNRDPGRRVPEIRSAAGLGLDLLGALLGFALVGYWIDRHFQSRPWGLLICLLLGLVGGLYNFLRDSLRALKAPLHGSRSPPNGLRPRDSDARSGVGPSDAPGGDDADGRR